MEESDTSTEHDNSSLHGTPGDDDDSYASDDYQRNLIRESRLNAPPFPEAEKRQKLSEAIHDLTCQWSEGFLEMAEEGDPASQYIVAQMALLPKGYGSIRYNKELGMRMLFKALETGDLEARAYARRVCSKELEIWLAKKELSQEDAKDPEKVRQMIEKMKKKEKQMQDEEAKRPHLLP